VRHNPHPKIIFQIASRKLTSMVNEPVDAIKSSCAEVGFTNYEIRLVVDAVENANRRLYKRY